MPILTAPVFLLSGSPRVGKTTLGIEIARIVRGSFVSFGDHVRFVATSTGHGSAVSRKELQDLGQRLVNHDPRGFCTAVVDGARDSPADPLIVDGLRHLSLLPILEDLLPHRDRRLIFVESSPEIRQLRWKGRPSEGEILAVDSHPVEADLNDLRRQADLVIDTSEGLDAALNQFVNWLTTNYPGLATNESCPGR